MPSVRNEYMTIARRFFAATPTIALALWVAGCGTAEEPDAVDDSPTEESQESENTDSGGDPEVLDVETTGDEGPIGLSTSQDAAGEATEASGELIVGPGSCFSLQPGDQPQLLVFGDDADFEVGAQQPAVTTGDLGTISVGDHVDLSVVEYSQDQIEDLPQQCANGADDTVLVLE